MTRIKFNILKNCATLTLTAAIGTPGMAVLASTGGVTLTARQLPAQSRSTSVQQETPDQQLVASGNQKLDAGDYLGAIQDYTEALRINPRNEIALRGRGIARRASGDYAGALADLNASIQLAPTDSWAFCQRGILYQVQHNLAAALEDYNKSIELFSGEASVFAQRGRLKYAQGDRDGALVDCSRAVALDPKMEDAWFVLGLINFDLRFNWSAANDFRQVLALDPDNGDAHYNLGNAYRNMGQRDDAIAEYRKAAQLYAAKNDSGDEHDALAQIAALQGAA